MHPRPAPLRQLLLGIDGIIYIQIYVQVMKRMKQTMEQTGTTKQLWLGEAGSSSGGGARNLSSTYASGFLFLGTLGLASKICHAAVIRQSLYGGYYGMIDSETHEPLPDYWTSLLFKKLVGNVSMEVHTNTNDLLVVHAYCNKENNDDVTLAVVNFSKCFMEI